MQHLFLLYFFPYLSQRRVCYSGHFLVVFNQFKEGFHQNFFEADNRKQYLPVLIRGCFFKPRKVDLLVLLFLATLYAVFQVGRLLWLCDAWHDLSNVSSPNAHLTDTFRRHGPRLWDAIVTSPISAHLLVTILPFSSSRAFSLVVVVTVNGSIHFA